MKSKLFLICAPIILLALFTACSNSGGGGGSKGKGAGGGSGGQTGNGGVGGQTGSQKISYINDINIQITEPQKGAIPSKTASVSNAGNFANYKVEWDPDADLFQGKQMYTVTITLTAAANYNFDEAVTAALNGYAANIIDVTNSKAVISYDFDETIDRELDSITILSQPQTDYTHGDKLDLSDLRVKLLFDDASAEIVPFENFLINGIETDLKDNAALSRLIHNDEPVVVTHSLSGKEANTDILNISKRMLTIAGAVHDKVYDGTSAASGVTVTFGNIAAGDTVSAGSVSAAYIDTKAGTTTITVSDVTLSGGAAGNYTVSLPQNVTVTGITKRPVTITPAAGQGKVYNTPDPLAFSYSPSEALIAGNSFTGALARASGNDAGSYAYTLGTLSAGANYQLTLSGSEHFTITKAAGAAVNTLTVGDAGTDSIKITAASLNSGTGQIMEYTYNTTGAAPVGGWADLAIPLTINSLASGTQYYVFVRAKESTNYFAGEAASESIWTKVPSSIQISFTNPEDPLQLTPSGSIVINLAAGTNITLSLPDGFANFEWFVNNVLVCSSQTFVLSASDFDRFDAGINILTVNAVKDGIPYGGSVPFTVVVE